MSNPQYVVTRMGTPSLLFGVAEGKLYKLSAKDGHPYYEAVSEGKLHDLCEIAERLNWREEDAAAAKVDEGPMTVDVKAEGDPVAVAEKLVAETVGIPTEESAEWQVRQVRILVQMAAAGKMNLAQFRRRVADVVGEEQ